MTHTGILNIFIKIFHKYVEITDENDHFVDSNIGKIYAMLNVFKKYDLTEIVKVSVAVDKLQSDSVSFSTSVEL